MLAMSTARIRGGLATAFVLPTVVLLSGALHGDKPKQTSEGKPAPANAFKGMQEREEVYEFSKKPAVKHEEGKWIITFASKGACDATVSILDMNGRVIRHLASGVLGKNAPYPFQQNTLNHKIEWDGLADDFKKAPAGCKVKVSLGLKPVFERNIGYDPYFLPGQERKKMLLAKAPDGTTYVCGLLGNSQSVRAYGKDGKYLRTALPPSAAELEKVATLLGRGTAATVWGDKVPLSARQERYGSFTYSGANDSLSRAYCKTLADAKAKSGQFDKVLLSFADAMEKCCGAKPDIGACPAAIPRPAEEFPDACFAGRLAYLAVDYAHEVVYVHTDYLSPRFDGKTGKWDKAYKIPPGGGGQDAPVIGYDGLIYYHAQMDKNNYGPLYIARFTRDGKMVPFKENTVEGPKAMKIYEGYDRLGVKKGALKDAPKLAGALLVSSQPTANYLQGFDVAPDGTIVCNDTSRNMAHTSVFDRDGRQLTTDVWANAPAKRQGDAVFMDRDGNMYALFGGVYPAGQKVLEGVAANGPPIQQGSGGSVVKFRGQGGKYPLGSFLVGKDAAAPPVGAVKTNEGAISGALWLYGGASNQSTADCNCAHTRFWLDRFARSWVPANQAASVMLLDSNGNRIARLGKYGNVDDTEADLKNKKDGLRFVWVKSVCASDNAMYVVDFGNQRILKATLSYAATETIPIP